LEIANRNLTIKVLWQAFAILYFCRKKVFDPKDKNSIQSMHQENLIKSAQTSFSGILF
jgi:hypothetical protein